MSQFTPSADTAEPERPRHSRRWALGFLVTAAAALAGCAAAGGVASGADENIEEFDAEYRLGAGDQLRVIVFGEPQLSDTFVVGSQGSISYPLVGDVQASGLTIPEFSAQLQAELSRFLRSPNVSVEVANYRPFFILGEVQRPGTYAYSASLTVHNAVATAGGFTYRANTRRVFIKHANENEEREYALTSATPVLPGDTVRIAERRF